jgi:hypothetical protein
MSNILFAKTHFNPLDKERATHEILKINKELWYWDTYRKTTMVPLMTKNARPGEMGANNIINSGEFEWVEYTPYVIREWFEDEIFPWMGRRTRISALLTEPNFANGEHIDCDINQVGTQQHKFRVVLQGNTGTLYYKTKEGNIHVPNIDEPFIMDGSWPHGMTNDSTKLKLTIAAGAPWTGNSNYNNIEVMMKRSDFTLPDDLSQYLKS